MYKTLVSVALSSALWMWSPEFMGCFLKTPVGPGMFLQEYLSKNQENMPSFQSTHLIRKSPRNLLRLKLEIVNTINL